MTKDTLTARQENLIDSPCGMTESKRSIKRMVKDREGRISSNNNTLQRTGRQQR